MKLRQLREFFPPERHDDIDRAYDQFAQKTGDDDVESFVIDLHERGLLQADTLRDILTLGEVSLSPPPDIEDDLPHLMPRHRRVGLLGKGAMGEVFIGRDPELLRTVAIKQIDPAMLHQKAAALRFFTEAQITAQLDHPSIVPIYGIERDQDGTLSYAMKLVRGRTLGEYLNDTREFYNAGAKPDEAHSLAARLELFLPVCNAMAYAHRRGILHRDLKPENIMVGAFHQVLVMDWGIARPLGDRERVTHGDGTSKTKAGAVVGTPNYMSPEQATGQTEGLGPASDQYALGLILFEIVTLQRAVFADSAFETVVKAASGHREPVIHMKSSVKVPRGLTAIIDKATAKEPAERYADVTSLAEDVRRFLRDEAVLAAPDTGLQRVTRWISHHRGTALAMGFGLIMAVFLVAAGLMWRNAVNLEEQRAAAHEREQHLVELSSIVVGQSHRMDTRFYEYEAMVTGLGYLAEHTVTQEAPETTQYWTDDFLGKTELAPADLVLSKSYGGQKISVTWPDFVAPTAFDRAAEKAHVNQLSTLTPTLRRILLRSAGEDSIRLPDAEQRDLIVDDEIPFIWVYAATEKGVLIGYPGLGEYPDNYDPREREWYTDAKAKRGAVWGSAEADESGMGLLMTCSRGFYGPKGEFLGVVALDVTFNYFIDALLDPPKIDGVSEAFLVDRAGKVAIRSTQKESARDHETYTQPDFEYGAVVAAAKQRSTGHMVLGDGEDAKIAIWSRLEATDWYYIIIGPETALLDAVTD